jgi:hypothetical protein
MAQVAVNHQLDPRHLQSTVCWQITDRAVRTGSSKERVASVGITIRPRDDVLGHAGVPCFTVITSVTLGVSYEARTLVHYLDITFVRSFSLEGRHKLQYDWITLTDRVTCSCSKSQNT